MYHSIPFFRKIVRYRTIAVNTTLNNSYYNNRNCDVRSLCVTALTSEDETNCAIKQENLMLKHQPPLKLGD